MVHDTQQKLQQVKSSDNKLINVNHPRDPSLTTAPEQAPGTALASPAAARDSQIRKLFLLRQHG